VKTNYHTHTTFCDGANTPEEVVRSAIGKGFSTIGFSSHSEMLKDPAAYVAEIRRLAAAYRDRIRVLCGLEADWPCPLDLAPYDYVIGSVHFVPTATGRRRGVDKSPEDLMRGIREDFGGSAEAFVRAYFATEREMVAAGRFTFVGHPDLVRKFNAKHPWFDEDATWYREELVKTADAIAACGKPVEVNTGAISRGWLDDAYPSAPFRALLRERGVRFVLSSDSHAADTIDCAFDRFGAAEDFVEPV
jgi:histidinol-phosphatase (PHP family)